MTDPRLLAVSDLHVRYPENRAVLAFFRRHGDELLLCVHNLSRFAQFAELDLRALDGWTPVELWSDRPFPRIGQLPYLLTLPGHGFYWFQLCGSEEKQ